MCLEKNDYSSSHTDGILYFGIWFSRYELIFSARAHIKLNFAWVLNFHFDVTLKRLEGYFYFQRSTTMSSRFRHKIDHRVNPDIEKWNCLSNTAKIWEKLSTPSEEKLSRNKYLQGVLDTDKKMLEVSLATTCGNTIGSTFFTDTGAPQGDCASTNEFTFYLAKLLGNNIPYITSKTITTTNLVPRATCTLFDFTDGRVTIVSAIRIITKRAKGLGSSLHYYFQKNIIEHETPDALQDHNCSQYTQVEHVTINMEYALTTWWAKSTAIYNWSINFEKEKETKN